MGHLSDDELLRVEKYLNEYKIYPRRYFYPSVNTYSKITKPQTCIISGDISERILCLPLYHKLAFTAVEKNIQIICKR